MEVLLQLWDELDDLVAVCRHKLLGPAHTTDAAPELTPTVLDPT